MELMEINQDLAIRLLLDNEDLISQDKVVNLLGNYPKIQVIYLSEFFQKNQNILINFILACLSSQTAS